MAKKKSEEQKLEEEYAAAGVYGGYDIEWLRRLPEHPDYHLVAEFDEKYGEDE